MPKKNTKQKTAFQLNIGTVLFGALALYLVILMVLYLTNTRIRSYQVTVGTLSKNEIYEALAFRNETVVTASSGGYLNYYVSDGRKAAKDEAVCVISDQLVSPAEQSLSAEDLSSIRNEADSYVRRFHPNQFQSVYDLSSTLSGRFYHPSQNIQGTSYKAEQEGIVAYSVDGREQSQIDQIRLSDFNLKNIQKTQLSPGMKITSGMPLYRLISGNSWTLMIPVDTRQSELLKDRKTIRLRFAKDGKTETGKISLQTVNDAQYAKIELTDGLSRYCNDRLLYVELVTNTKYGLKIPVSAVVSKEFFTVPAEFVTKGGSSGSSGFLKETTDSKGRKTTEFIPSSIYDTDENGSPSVYYLDAQSVKKGDVLVQTDSNKRYEIASSAKLDGVYNMNRGYAIFRRIHILEQNHETCIAEIGTSYGIAQYDYIVRNGKQVKEKEILQ